jgi:hypothetical protein
MVGGAGRGMARDHAGCSCRGRPHHAVTMACRAHLSPHLSRRRPAGRAERHRGRMPRDNQRESPASIRMRIAGVLARRRESEARP